ncbi:N-acetyltransferase 9 [Protopterus annectens]|uniref:N-acetyltransferase 9 n=1 Tax=Protopterus annectens TaxID=7888 RepID=UPI001CFBDEEA|nr:N-acetyltransferase 9 [Protopterus annectens]XP_043941098.1 N-acetyltransferase 9 [Protopterus annectens]
MRINENTLLEGKLAVLVPYNPEHVPRYHKWMKSEELQKLTASEPLTLEQEYNMQRSWREDSDKCTFIVLDKQKWNDPAFSEEDAMVGDVNLFLTDPCNSKLAEIEVMIAEPSYRGRGFGKEVTLMMLYYGITKLEITKFEAKIGLQNAVSISMFQAFHFVQVSVSEVFQEMTLQVLVNEERRQWFSAKADFMKEKDYRKTQQQSRETGS